MAWLVDTNILSEVRKPRPDRRVLSFLNQSPLDQLLISTVILAEFRLGIELVAEPNRRVELNRWLEESIRPMFQDRTFRNYGGNFAPMAIAD